MKDQPREPQPQPRMSVKDTVHKFQLALLEGTKTLDHLYLAGSVISRSDYNDVVTERSIDNRCGYPLCLNALPSESSLLRKGHYRISLKEHKVYDLHETYMYCSSGCVIDSKAFAQSLSEERCDVLDFAKVERILRVFGDVAFDRSEVGLGEIGDLGISDLKIEGKSATDIGDLGISGLKIEEKSETHVGDLGLVGPSNAIEGYVPQKERKSKLLGSKKNKEGSKDTDEKMTCGNTIIFNEMDFMSTIITSDEYSVSKIAPSVMENDFEAEIKESKEEVGLNKNGSEKKSRQSKKGKSKFVKKGIQEVPSTSESREETLVEKAKKSNEAMLRSSLTPSGPKKLNRSVTWADETIDSTRSRNICEVRDMEHRMGDPDAFRSKNKTSLKLSAENQVGCSITTFDEKTDSTKSKNICEVTEVQDEKEGSDINGSWDLKAKERVESAEACAMALSQAAEAVALGESDVNSAVSEAGIMIIPCPDGMDEEAPTEDVDMLDPEQARLWPNKPGIPPSDFFDPDDSFFDEPPEGFSLTLSPFATMWNSLFTWITSSTLAYIYGRDESFHEEFLSINGRHFPPKIVLAGGRSFEIKKTLAESLARALPGVVSVLKLATPVSSLEQGMGCMLETMSFVDALPAFRMKQWQVIVLLFLEGLSVCRIPALTDPMTNKRTLLHRVLDGSQITAEHYELIKDLVIPRGRAS